MQCFCTWWISTEYTLKSSFGNGVVFSTDTICLSDIVVLSDGIGEIKFSATS